MAPLSWITRMMWPSNRIDANIPPPPLLALPVELIETIFIYSQNPLFPQTSRLLYQMLSTDYMHLKLCSYVFREGCLRSGYETTALPFLEEQAAIESTLISQKWFTTPFAKRLQNAVPALRQAAQSTEHKSGAGVAFGVPSFRVANNPCTRMPRWLFMGPWTDEKIELFCILRGWYVEPDVSPAGGNLLSSSLFRAVQEGRTELVKELNWYMRAGMVRGQDVEAPRMPRRQLSISVRGRGV